MVDLRILKKTGLSEDSLKRTFTSENKSDKLQRLYDRIRDHYQTGIDSNWKNYKLYYAIDQAWNAPFHQATETLIRAIHTLHQSKSSEDKQRAEKTIHSVLKDWGLAHIITEETDPKTGKPTGRKLLRFNQFYRVMIPVVQAYVKIRWAKLYNDRLRTPFLPFEPFRNTAQQRLMCEIITDRVELMSRQMGYTNAVKQSIFQYLLYGVCLMFPQESWYSEEQWKFVGDERPRKFVSKEGIRYRMPHPSRMYYDLVHPVSSFNTDTGCEYAGYWRVTKYRELKSKHDLWNVEKIGLPKEDFISSHSAYFATVYPCSLAAPVNMEDFGDSTNREDELQNQYYSSTYDEAAIISAEHFEKIIPKQYGLGSYDCPVWFRFVLGATDTILYAEPLPSSPVIAMPYDADENRHLNASLGLEAMPFQDQISNLLTQTILSVKQNLANLTFVDTNIVDEEDIQRIENKGEEQYRSLNFVRFDGRQNRHQQKDVREAFASVRFPQLDAGGCINAISTVLSLLERVLVMSSQETGSAASHEQTARESEIIATSTNTRLVFTGHPIDEAIDALKLQQYNYLMNYGEPEFWAQIPAEIPLTPDVLMRFGWTVEEHSDGIDKALISGNLTALPLIAFTSARDGRQKIGNASMAQSMVQLIQMVTGNAELFQQVGSVQIFNSINMIAHFLGLPDDFKFQPQHGTDSIEQLRQEMQQHVMGLAEKTKMLNDQTKDLVAQSVGKAMEPIAKSINELSVDVENNAQEIEGNIKAINQIREVISAANAEV